MRLLVALLHNNRPPVNERKFISTAIENVINQVILFNDR